MKKEFLILVTDLLSSLYEKHKGFYLPFEIDAHADRLDVAKAVVRGIASDYDLQLAMGYAQSQNIPEVGDWAHDVIDRNHQYVMGRIGISNMYTALTAQLEAANDDNILQTSQALFAQSQEQLLELAGSNADIQNWLRAEIKSIGVKLGLLEPDIVEVAEVLNLKDPLSELLQSEAEDLAEELDESE